MQDIRFNDKNYVLFNSGEQFIKEPIKYPINQYDGYSLLNIFGNEMVYVNTKPVIVIQDGMIKDYYSRGEVFAPLDENEKLYDTNTHLIYFRANHVDYHYEDDKNLICNYRIISYDFHGSSTYVYYSNIVPVVVNPNNQCGVSLEENVQLKLRRYTI